MNPGLPHFLVIPGYRFCDFIEKNIANPVMMAIITKSEIIKDKLMSILESI